MKTITVKAIAYLLVTSFLLSSVSIIASAEKLKPQKKNHKYQTTQIIVKYKEGFSYDSIKSDYEKKVKKPKKQTKLKNTKKDILTVSSFEETEQAIKALNKLPEIEYAVPDDMIESYEANQAFDAVASVAIGFEDAYELADGTGVTVAVLDTGIKIDLPEFRNRIIPGGYDFANSDNTVYDDPSLDAHGTQVAGILAAAAPGVKILPLKFMNGSTGYTSDAIEAIEYAKSLGIKIVNCSWGSENNNLALKETIANSDMLFICAGGNMTYDGSNVSYPSAFSLPNVISVGAVNSEGKVAEFTNTGTTHALYAPGVNVETISPQGRALATGTSYAAPFVTAAAALMLQTAPKLGAELIASCLREGYEEQRYIKLVHAQKAVEAVLPYAMLDDSDGRISKLCGLYGGLLPPEAAGLIAKSDTPDDLSDEEKAVVLNCFDLKQTELSGLNHDLVGALLIGLVSKKADIAVGAADKLLSVYEAAAPGRGYHKLYSELILLSEYKKLLAITEAEKIVFLNKMENGCEAAALFRALIFARATSSSFEAVIGDWLNTDLLQNMEEEERFRVMEIMQTYRVSASAVLSVLEKEASALALGAKLFGWQQEHNISLSDDEQQTQGTVPAYYKSDFGKYKVQTGDVWTYDNFIIDKTDGMASYYQPLVDIPAQGGMNLSFGIRFDPEVADIVSNVKTPGNLGDACFVLEDRLYYTKIGSSWVRDSSKDQTAVVTHITEEDLPYQYSRDGMEVMVDSNYKYIVSVDNISSYISAPESAAVPAVTNYYDNIYGLGTAIGTNMPVIEIDGVCKYLHLGDGRKYEIDSTYRLNGYLLSDMTLSPDAASFSANGVASAYQLSYVSGVTEYFAADGKYLGKKDLSGNKLEVHYNTEGKISKIIEPSGRYLGFTYSSTPSRRTIEIRLHDNASGSTPAKLLYTITAQQNTAQTGFILAEITNALGRSNTYSFIEADQAVTINGRSSVFSPTSYTNRTIYPHAFYGYAGAAITLSYSTANKTYGLSSARSYPRLVQISRNNGYGTASFTYQSGTDTAKVNESTAYWMYNDRSLLYKSAKSGYNAMTIGTRKEEYVIDRYGYGLYTRLYHANKLMTQSTQASYDNYGFPVSSVYAYNYNLTLTFRKFTTYAHDQYGNLIGNGNYASYGTTNGISRTANRFDYAKSKSIPIVTITNIEKDDSGYIKKQAIFHEIDAVYNRITKATVKAFLDKNNNDRIDIGEEEAPLSETTYHYDQYGNIISTASSEYRKENGVYVRGTETVSNITYDSLYHAYPIRAETPDIIDADGNSSSIVTSSEYNIQGIMTASYDANGHKTGYEYDAVGNLIKTNYYEKIGDVQTLRYTDQMDYDYTNRKITAKPFMGPWTETTYDVYGNVARVRESVNKGVTWQNLREETYNTLLQNISSKQYTTNGEYILVSRTFNWQNQIASEIARAYYANNTLKEQLSHVENTYEYVGSNDLVTTVTKDAAGNTLTKSQTQSNNFGVTSVKTWDNASTAEPQYTDYTVYGEYGVVKRTYGESTIDTDYKYDIAGRQNATVTGSTPDGVTQYTGYGMVHKSVTEANRKKGIAEGDEYKYASLYSYDKLGRQILVRDPFEMNGSEISYAETKNYYDNAGNIVKTMKKTNETGERDTWSTTEYTYDWRGLLLMTRQVADFSFQDIYTQYLYNAAGLKVKEYTGMNKPLEIEWHFDSEGNVVVDSEISSEISETSYEYDARGNLVKYTDPLGKSDEMAYNELGQLTYKRLRNGKAFKYTYNASGQLATEQAGTAVGTFSKGTFTGSFTQAGNNKVTYTYDSSGNLKQMADTVGTWSYTYDDMGRVLTETMPGGYKAATTYVDKLKTDYVLTDTAQDKTYVKQRYAHDDKGRLTVITNETEANETYGIWYTYDEFNQLRNRSYSYGRDAVFQNPTSVQSFSYNLAGLTERITGYTNEVYTYYLDGKIASVTNGGVAGVYYSYDRLGRLKAETEKNSSGIELKNCIYMVYDARGNCTYKEENGSTIPSKYHGITYDKANRMIEEHWTINQQTSTRDYTYDDSGNLLTEEGVTYTYDAWNRTAGVGTTTFAYDGLGRRFSKTGNGVTNRHIWNGDEIIYDTETASTYIHGLFAEGTLRGGRLSGYTLYLNLVNARGDVTGIRAINTYGSNVDWGGKKYDAYGNVRENTTKASVTPYGYAGEYTDGGLQYLRSRYYDPSTGRFTQEDTWLDQGPNLYTYCGNDPVNNVDPSGHLVTPGPDGKLVMVHGIGFPPDTSYKEESWLYDIADFYNVQMEDSFEFLPIYEKGYEIIMSIGIGFILGNTGAITISDEGVSTKYGMFDLGFSLSQTTVGFSFEIDGYTYSTYTRYGWIDSWYGASLTYTPIKGPYVTLKVEWTYNRLSAMAFKAKVAAMVLNPASASAVGVKEALKMLLKVWAYA